MKKMCFFAFRGEPMCFTHVLLNGLRFKEMGYETKIVIEGESTKIIPVMFDENSILYNLMKKALNLGIIEGVCETCSKKMGTYEFASNKGLKMLNDMMGHPSIEQFVTNGYQIITF